MRSFLPGALVAITLLAQTASASAGGVKWAKTKFSCKNSNPARRDDPASQMTYSAPKGWVRDDTREPPCPYRIHVDAPGGGAHVEFATVRARISVEERAKWHIKDAVVTTKAGWTCGEGVAVDWDGNPSDPPQRVVRCTKAIGDGNVILIGSLVASAAEFKKFGGKAALLAALKVLKGMNMPTENES